MGKDKTHSEGGVSPVGGYNKMCRVALPSKAGSQPDLHAILPEKNTLRSDRFWIGGPSSSHFFSFVKNQEVKQDALESGFIFFYGSCGQCVTNKQQTLTCLNFLGETKSPKSCVGKPLWLASPASGGAT